MRRLLLMVAAFAMVGLWATPSEAQRWTRYPRPYSTYYGYTAPYYSPYYGYAWGPRYTYYRAPVVRPYPGYGYYRPVPYGAYYYGPYGYRYYRPGVSVWLR